MRETLWFFWITLLYTNLDDYNTSEERTHTYWKVDPINSVLLSHRGCGTIHDGMSWMFHIVDYIFL